MSRARILLTALLLPPAAAAGLAALLAQGGRWNWRLDVLTHFAPIYVALGVATLMAALMLRADYLRLILALCGAASLFGGLALILPELTRPMSPPAPADAPGQIKLIQFNMRAGKDGLDKAILWLAAENPDILVVEESDKSLRDVLGRRLNLQASCGQTCTVTIFSRETPRAVERPRRGFYGKGPSITIAELEDARGPFSVVGIHFTWPTDRWQQENNRRLEQILKDHPRERLIIAGDFNSTPWSFSRRRSDKALGMERRTRAMFSWPAGRAPGFPFLPIDHVYAGPGWATVSVTRGPSLGSDHYPIVTVLAPRP